MPRAKSTPAPSAPPKEFQRHAEVGRGDVFGHAARHTAHAVGTPWAFATALGIVLVWILTGPIFKWSDTWQLVINTGTTIITFLMVFLIQNTQNRDSHALHLKLDELIRSNEIARNWFLSVEDFDEQDMTELQAEFNRLAREKTARRRGVSVASLEAAEDEAVAAEGAAEDDEPTAPPA